MMIYIYKDRKIGFKENGVQAYDRPVSSGGSCAFPSGNIEYSQVCGKVIGYQDGYPDEAHHTSSSMNSYYSDGISFMLSEY